MIVKNIYIYIVTGSWRRDPALVDLRSGSGRPGVVRGINSNDNTLYGASRDGLRTLAARHNLSDTLPGRAGM